MPFLHLPIQSGSNKVLENMNRKHSREEYLSIIDSLLKAKPNMKFSSDFIVGYPGESDEDFNETITFWARKTSPFLRPFCTESGEIRSKRAFENRLLITMREDTEKERSRESPTCDPTTPAQSKHTSPFSDFCSQNITKSSQNDSQNAPNSSKKRPEHAKKQL